MIVPAREIAPAKLNLALHVRGKLADGRHAIETIGRNFVNSENRPRNHAKLPIVIAISVIEGW